MTHIRLWDGPAPGSEDWDQEEVPGPEPGWMLSLIHI